MLLSYLNQAPVVTKAHGGVPIATYDVETVLDNGEKPAVFSVISSPSREAIEKPFNDPEYKILIPERDLGFSYLRYYTVNEGIDDTQINNCSKQHQTVIVGDNYET